MIGTEIGSYRILDKLGEGGMGVVYKAIDTGLDRLVAVKVLGAELAKNPELVTRFRSEAKAQANLNHTNLATLYAFLVVEENAFMVMEYVEGETFQQMIARRGPIPEQEAIQLFRQALVGIGFAHHAGILHRDIKPSNIMVNKKGVVKVMDFGIAKVMGARSQTRTGTQLGTIAYMSPEQIQGRRVDIRSDIYELGITLYEMLSGRVPFENESDFQIMQDHVRTPPPLPSRFYPYIRREVENVVLKALEKSPEARFQTVEQFSAALEHPEALIYTPVASAMDATTAPVNPPSGFQAYPPGTAPGTAPMVVPGMGPPSGTASQPASAYVPPGTSAGVPATAPPISPTGAPPYVPAAAGVTTSAAASRSGKSWTIIGVGVVVLALIAVAFYYRGMELLPGMRRGPATAQSSLPVPPAAPPQTPPNAQTGAQSSGQPGAGAVPQTSSASAQPPAVVPPDAASGGGSSHTLKSDAASSPALAPRLKSKPKPTAGDEQASAANAAAPADDSKSEANPNLPSDEQMMQNAQAAFDQNHFFQPINNSALFWAIQARNAGNANAQDMESQIQDIYKRRMKIYYAKKDYRSALVLLNLMLIYYPKNPSLLAEQKRIEDAIAESQ